MAENEGTETNKETTEAGKEPPVTTLTPEQQKNVDSAKAAVLAEAAKEKSIPGFTTTPEKEAEVDYKSEYESLTSDPALKVLLDYKKTGKNIADLFASVKTESIDVTKIPRKDVFSQMLTSNNFTKEEVDAETKRFDALSPLQQENEVKEFRNSLKSKSTGSPDIFKTIQETVNAELPKQKEYLQKETSYKNTVAQTIKGLKDIEGKDYPKETAEKIWNYALSLSSKQNLTPEAAKQVVETARLAAVPQESFMAGVAYGAEKALRQFYSPNAGVESSSRGTAGKGTSKAEHVYDPDTLAKIESRKKQAEALNAKK